MFGRPGALLKWIVLLPVIAAVLLLAVANDQSVTIHLYPFDTDDPVLRADLPLYQVAFIVFVAGALTGALVAWSGELRRRARRRREQAALQQSLAAPSGAPRSDMPPRRRPRSCRARSAASSRRCGSSPPPTSPRFTFPDLIEALRHAFRKGAVTPVRAAPHDTTRPASPSNSSADAGLEDFSARRRPIGGTRSSMCFPAISAGKA